VCAILLLKERRYDMNIICPECKSRNIMFTKRNNSFWCRHCGEEWKKVKEVENVERPKEETGEH
jgi:ribosomal protein L37AE/L43A